jgi:flagellar hook-length control protein FliK
VINSENSVPVAEKANINETDNPQTLSESLQNKNRETILGRSDSSFESNAQKIKVANVQISSEQIKSHVNKDAPSGNNSGSEFGQTLQQSDLQVPVTEQSQSATENTKTSETSTQTLQNNVSTGVGKQILESIQNSTSSQSGDQQITVRLNPPELGKVYIKFREQDNQITGLMEVSKTQTRIEIEQALPQIVRNLADSGIQVRRFEVVLNDSGGSEQDAVKDQLFQDDGTRHQGSTNSGTHENNSVAGQINEWIAGNNSYQNISELQEMLTAEGSINVLL